MTDVLTPEQRHRNMANIRSRHTGPEIKVRSIVHRLGYRYRLHVKDLPGKPDLVFPSRSRVIYVHGCFWHLHDCKYGRATPKTNAKFWANKRKSNATRDRRNLRALRHAGWKVAVVWECELKAPDRVRGRLERFLRRRW